jgi:hypothetical protein
MDECQHKRLAHWRSLRSNTHTGRCHACGIDFGPFETWEEVRLAAGRKPYTAKKPVSERAILEAAAERVCNACISAGDCVEKCGTIKAILEPITKEKP